MSRQLRIPTNPNSPSLRRKLGMDSNNISEKQCINMFKEMLNNGMRYRYPHELEEIYYIIGNDFQDDNIKDIGL